MKNEKSATLERIKLLGYYTLSTMALVYFFGIVFQPHYWKSLFVKYNIAAFIIAIQEYYRYFLVYLVILCVSIISIIIVNRISKRIDIVKTLRKVFNLRIVSTSLCIAMVISAIAMALYKLEPEPTQVAKVKVVPTNDYLYIDKDKIEQFYNQAESNLIISSKEVKESLTRKADVKLVNSLIDAELSAQSGQEATTKLQPKKLLYSTMTNMIIEFLQENEQLSSIDSIIEDNDEIMNFRDDIEKLKTKYDFKVDPKDVAKRELEMANELFKNYNAQKMRSNTFLTIHATFMLENGNGDLSLRAQIKIGQERQSIVIAPLNREMAGKEFDIFQSYSKKYDLWVFGKLIANDTIKNEIMIMPYAVFR